MQNRNLLIIIGALVIAGISVFLLNAYLTGVEEQAEVRAEEQKLARIVVATREINFGEPLTTENTRLQNFPANSVPTGAFRSLETALANDRVALRPIVPGEPILASKVSGADGRAVLAANLPEGKRAVSIAIGPVTGVSGFVRPGDTVDVLLTRKIPGEGADAEDLVSDVILDRVKVLAIDQVASESATEPKTGSTAVLEVELFEAQQLAIAGRLGTLSLALRNVKSQEEARGQAMTNRSVGSRLYIPAKPQPRQAAAPAPPIQPSRSVVTVTGPAPAAAPIKPVPTGPQMTIFRGTESESYPVGRLRGQ